MYRICYSGGLVDKFKDFEDLAIAVFEKVIWHNMFYNAHTNKYGCFFDLQIDYKKLAKDAYGQAKKQITTIQSLNELFDKEGLSIVVEGCND